MKLNKPFRIYVTSNTLADEAKVILSENGCITQYGNPLDSPEELKEKLRVFNPDGLIVHQGKIRKDTLEVLPDLKVISKHGVGVDSIDIEAATTKCIPVMITANANYESVAEHSLALLLSLMRRIPTQNSALKAGVFNKTDYDGEDLLNSTVGMIGFGRIGKRFAELLSCFNTNILVYDPYVNSKQLASNIKLVNEVEILFKSSDIVSLFCSLHPDTKGIINKSTLSLMKQSSYILNTARGALINEADLIDALQQKCIAGAALDTFEIEPPAKNNPLFKLDNVILTSHVGGTSKNSLINMGVGAVNNAISVLTDSKINRDCVINKDILTI